MLKTLKRIRTGALFLSVMFLFVTNVFAQSIMFSSDQWPKRWERAMRHVSLNGHVTPPDYSQRNHSRTDGVRNVVEQGGWGKSPGRLRHEHKRSRTPEYFGTYHRYDEDPVKQRFALPNSQNDIYGYGAYSNSYYGSTIPVIPHLPVSVYPAPLYGGYPGMYPGLGVPGMYPFGGYPGVGYPW